MKINFYIITYRNYIGLEQCLSSLEKTNIPNGISLNINIINNHSDFVLPSQFEHISVLHNSIRPDWSTGHLSRSWNQAIINGFRSLKSPEADIVVVCQVDTVFHSNWLHRLLEQHQKYDFITAGWGDAFLSFSPEAIHNIGLFDERFNNIVHQECDYFTRALIFNKEKSSINDFHHGLVLNSFLNGKDDYSIVEVKNSNRGITWNSTVQTHEHNQRFLLSKYDRSPLFWDIDHPPVLLKKLNILYPYFEFDIRDITSKYEIY